MTQRTDIRGHEGKTPSGPQNATAFFQQIKRIVDVLDDVGHCYGIEAILRASELFKKSAVYLEASACAGLRSLSVEIYTLRPPT
jgi:hypothetical protein